MKFKSGSILFLLSLMLLPSCKRTPEQGSSATDSSSTTKTKVTIDKYVGDVASTAPIMIAGLASGQKVDYVVSSYPVIFSAFQKNPKLRVVRNVAEDFSKKFGTEGFPQAGLFIRRSLSDDQGQSAQVSFFLHTFDTDVNDLIQGGKQTAEKMNGFSHDEKVQRERFGFTSHVIQEIQKTNGLAFLSKEKNPDIQGFSKFKTPLGIQIQKEDLSSYYTKDVTSSLLDSDLSFHVVAPLGAPSAALVRYASDTEKLDLTTPANVSAAFKKNEADFILFDSVNGLKLSSSFDHEYLLVRMVTFGNLYLVATGNDKDEVISEDDYIVGYGENLVPDLAFRAVYS